MSEENYEAGRLFRSIVPHKNVFTPNIIEYFSIENGAVELSSGDVIFGEGIKYGVTIVKDGKHNTDLSKLFFDKTEAINYIKTL